MEGSLLDSCAMGEQPTGTVTALFLTKVGRSDSGRLGAADVLEEHNRLLASSVRSARCTELRAQEHERARDLDPPTIAPRSNPRHDTPAEEGVDTVDKLPSWP